MYHNLISNGIGKNADCYYDFLVIALPISLFKINYFIFEKKLLFLNLFMVDASTEKTIDFMLERFKPERYAYLIMSIASFVLLITAIVAFMAKNEMNEKNFTAIAGMMGSGGAIAYSTSQLLRIWKDCIGLISKSIGSNSHGQ